MASQRLNQEKPLLPRCLAISLKEKRGRRSSPNLEAGRDGNMVGMNREELADAPTNTKKAAAKFKFGVEVFDSFVAENRICCWDPHLEESILNLKYFGHLYPNTLLVGGRDIYVDTVRNAWERKVLQPPDNFSLHKMGETGPMSVDRVPQAPFMPLPEALCLATSLLCRGAAGQTASLDAIIQQLSQTYRGAHQPSEQVVYHTLGSLLKERKLYHNGCGYSIATPETFHLNGCLTVQDHQLVIGSSDRQHGTLPTIYIPLAVPPVKMEMRSISCQTEENVNEKCASFDVNNGDEVEYSRESNVNIQDTDRRDTNISAVIQDHDIVVEKHEKSSHFERSQSLKLGKSRERKQTDSLNRTSLLSSKENEDDRAVDGVNMQTLHREKDKGDKTSLLSKLFGRKKKLCPSDEKGAVEYVTFSAQFPPAEWQWYRLHEMTQHDQQLVSNSTTTSGARYTSVATVDACQIKQGICGLNVQSDCSEEETEPDHYECLTERHPIKPSVASVPDPSSHDLTSKLLESRQTDQSRRDHQYHQQCDPRPKRSVRRRSHSQNIELGDMEDHHLSTAAHGRPVNKQAITEMNSLQGHGMDGTKTQAVPHLNNTSCQASMKECADETSNEYYMVPSGVHHHTDGHLVDHNQYLDDKPRSRRSRVFKKYKELQYSSFANNTDISMNYEGYLSKKNISCTKSRDSGVNCVGLTEKLPPKDEAWQVEPQRQISSKLNLHKARNHTITEQSYEDSGFNSPRTADYSELPVAHETRVQAPGLMSHPSHNLLQMEVNPSACKSSDVATDADVQIQAVLPDSQPFCGSSSCSGSLHTVCEVQPEYGQKATSPLPKEAHILQRHLTHSTSAPTKISTHHSAGINDTRREHLLESQYYSRKPQEKMGSYDSMPTVQQPGDEQYRKELEREKGTTQHRAHGRRLLSGNRNINSVDIHQDGKGGYHYDHKHLESQPASTKNTDYQVVGVV